ncbi:sensor histidine kinase [Kocuria oceani]|uniref:histidine kinase n=2 Tax=Kocuria TaxID=57493 RepID=A0ABV9TMB7_9MICC|nr:HAMP domain-containing sensor histidine kinase [Kocuria oceani]
MSAAAPSTGAPPATMTGAPRHWGSLTARMMLAQAAVLAAGLVTVILTAALIGPAMFYRELILAGHADEAAGLDHLQDAFREVGLTAMATGGIPALYIAGLLSFYLHRTVGRSLRAFTSAAREVADGHYDVQVPTTGLGQEFDVLAVAFNDMAARLAAIDTTRRQMLADLAHEMRTPLASLKGHLEGIEDGVVDLDERTQAILAAQIARLERLARDIRELTVAEEGLTRLHPSPVDPQHLVAQAVAGIHPAATAKDVTVTTSGTGAGTGPVLLDPERIGQVLANLLENALRHTAPGGHVHVRTERADHALSITVSDDGEGIAPEHLPHVLQRFYRAAPGREHDRDRSGSGLGLAISKALVEAHGGTLEAASPGPGQGASFRLLLPDRSSG